MLNYSKPDFGKAYSMANELLISSAVILAFPFSAKALVKEQTTIVCRSFKKAKKYGVNMTDFGSKSAVIMKFHGRTIIFYDETKPDAHIAFSILHELGHEVNKHDFTKKDEKTYHKYEAKTNYFAAQLLMPEQLLRELQRRGVCITRELLQSAFGVSKQAADKRLTTLAKTNSEWRSRAECEFDDIILYKFADFLDSVCPLKNMYDFEYEYNRQLERCSWL